MLANRTGEMRIVPVLPCVFPSSPPLSASPLRRNSQVVFNIELSFERNLAPTVSYFFFLNQTLFDFLRFFQSSRRTFSLTKKIALYIKKIIQHSRSKPKSTSFTIMYHISLHLRHYSQTNIHRLQQF